METILEDQRRLHEERERLIDLQTKEFLRKKATTKEQINSDHLVKLLWDKYIESTSNLITLYEDKDGLRKKEIQLLSGPNEYSEFNSRLKSIISYHKKGNLSEVANISVPMSIEYDNLIKLIQSNDDDVGALVNFTDEEGYGKYLDLNELYQKYINLKGVEKINYIAFLSTYDHLFKIPRERKNQDYLKYLQALFSYVFDYMQRVKPLLDVNKEVEQAYVEFQTRWTEGTFPGWPKETTGALTKSGAYLDLSSYSSWEELASLGLDRLKSALMALGLKCGGSLQERAIRLFQTKGKRLQDLDPSLFAKPQQNSRSKEYNDKHKEIAELEAKIYRLAEILGPQRNATIENVQRKQALTPGEREQEEEAEIVAEESEEEDEDDGIIYNPKNLPLGWDGKPIPYWLYKLHGLNLYYNCEICGNHKYRGPKAFQRHFSEWRHAHGMRCLGIPNTAHFANITLIEDAVQLWEKLRVTRETERFIPDNQEEYEDSHGNVLNKKTYDDLKRQGLL
ncbi:splicing factor 3A subunit 3 [Brachionus plicatilis]|uniref:Splicing factor 3A subunit 3 n=1 Tax=Brachionus plicatilis TaxID=10195 RepID=A0A3M7RAR1_BRAPC|nr:splicing factor 3A subunit 3 [Brachionus plicatilis]